MFFSVSIFKRNDEITVDWHIKKNERYGFNIIGGNKCGIFVDAIQRWAPADTGSISKYRKLLKVDLSSLVYCIVL